jgi:hypothetical protein
MHNADVSGAWLLWLTWDADIAHRISTSKHNNPHWTCSVTLWMELEMKWIYPFAWLLYIWLNMHCISWIIYDILFVSNAMFVLNCYIKFAMYINVNPLIDNNVYQVLTNITVTVAIAQMLRLMVHNQLCDNITPLKSFVWYLNLLLILHTHFDTSMRTILCIILRLNHMVC